MLRSDLVSAELLRAQQILQNIARLKAGGLPTACAEGTLKPYLEPVAKTPKAPKPPKAKRQKVEPSRASKRLAVATAVDYTESPPQQAPMPRPSIPNSPTSSPELPCPRVTDPASSWIAYFASYPLTAEAIRADRNKQVAEWLASEEYFLADFRALTEKNAIAAATALSAALSIPAGSQAAYQAALVSLQQGSGGAWAWLLCTLSTVLITAQQGSDDHCYCTCRSQDGICGQQTRYSKPTLQCIRRQHSNFSPKEEARQKSRQ